MWQPPRSRSLIPTGFTLLQLIVVIAIIGLVSTIATVASRREVGKTREAKRVHELREVQEALELYWLDNRKYPPTFERDAFGNIIWQQGWNGWVESCLNNNYIPGLAPKYIAKLPQDALACPDPYATPPIPGHDGFWYSSNGTDYKLTNHTENSAQPLGGLLLNFIDPAQDEGPNPCIIDGSPPEAYHFTVYSLGAVCTREGVIW